MKSRVFLVMIFAFLICSVAFAANFDATTFNYLGNGDAETMDPSKAYDVASSEIIFQCYDNLVQYKQGSLSEFEPLLATKVPSVENGLISKDGKTYTFPIRKGVKFHNGAILTPQDVEYSFERNMLADPNGGPIWMLLEPLMGVASISEYACNIGKVDDFSKVSPDALLATAKAAMAAVEVQGNNVVFHLAKPYPPFMAILARDSSWTVIQNKKWMIDNGDWDGKADNWTKWHDLPTEKQTLFDKEMGT
ncbi:MAG TPA: ABC transporter substrate-binding protein, partial [Bacillota bacterium]|nr:ABC transporter substrate-binding protein [Bacillota bacterium]